MSASKIGYMAKREGNEISVTNCIGGRQTIVHEADNGVLVVRYSRHKSFDDKEVPVKYGLGRLLDPEQAKRVGAAAFGNSAHREEYPLVYCEIGERATAGMGWRVVLREMVEAASLR
jgi:hypothetical protein